MPDTPTSVVNGQSVCGPALQASISRLSFAPAATSHGCAGSTVTAGSFCLFLENGPSGLPTETSVSPVVVCATAANGTATSAAITRASSPVRNDGLIGHHLLGSAYFLWPITGRRPRAPLGW